MTKSETIVASVQLVWGKTQIPLENHAAIASAAIMTHAATHAPITDNNRVLREQKSDMKTADKTQAPMIIQVEGFVML